MPFLFSVFFAAAAMAQTPKLIHCWVTVAQGNGTNGAIESNAKKLNFALDKSADISKTEKTSLNNQDSTYSYSVTIEKDTVAFMTIGDQKSGFSAISAPRRILSDQEGVVLTLRKALPENKFQIAELNCAKEAFFSKLKAVAKE